MSLTQEELQLISAEKHNLDQKLESAQLTDANIKNYDGKIVELKDNFFGSVRKGKFEIVVEDGDTTYTITEPIGKGQSGQDLYGVNVFQKFSDISYIGIIKV